MFSWVLDRHEEGCHEKKSIFTCVLVCTGLSNDDVGVVARGTVFQDIRPGAGFKTGNFVEEELGGGATAERLTIIQTNSPALRFDAGRPMQWLEGGGGEMLSFHA